MDIQQILKVLKNERECIARQSRPHGEKPQCRKDDNGVKLCEYCDLCLPDNEILEAYDFVLKLVEGISVDRPTIIYKGMALYLTDGHIEALMNYERDQMLKDVCDRIKSSFDEMPSAEFMRKHFGLPLHPLDNGVVNLKREGDTE